MDMTGIRPLVKAPFLEEVDIKAFTPKHVVIWFDESP